MQGLQQKKVNFIERLHDDPQRDMASRRKMQLLLPLLLAVVVVAGVWAYFQFFVIAPSQTSLAEKQAYLADSTVQMDLQKANNLEADIAALQAQISNANAVFDNMDSFAEINKAMYNAINQHAVAGSITVTEYSYDRKTGILTLSCEGADALAASTYVNKLREDKYFLVVTYVGYSGSPNDKYAFTVTCQKIQTGEGVQ